MAHFHSINDVWDSLERLSDVMAQGYPDLNAALSAGLKFILDILDKKTAVIIVLSKDGVTAQNLPSDTADNAVSNIAGQGLTEGWQRQLIDPLKFVKSLKCEGLASGQIKVISKAQVGKIVIIPLYAQSSRLGLLLLEGSINGSLDRTFLKRVGHAFGHMLYVQDNFLDFMERSNKLDAELGRVLTSFNINLEVNEAQLQVAQIIRNTFNSQTVVMAFVDLAHEGVLFKKTLSDDSDRWLYQVGLEPGQGVIGESIHKRKSILLDNPESHPQYKQAIDGIPGKKIKSLLCVPLGVEGQLLGAIELVNYTERQFTLLDQQLLNSVSSSIAAVLYNMQLVNQLKVLNAELEANTWELTRSRNTLRSLFDNMPFSVYIVDREYRLIAVNKARAQRAHKDPRELAGQSCYVALYGLGEPCSDCLVTRTLYGKKITNRKKRLRGDSDEVFEWDINAYPIISDAGDVVQAILFEQDITERRRLEAILAQSEKLAAIGQLAAGLAHEINNPLTVIMANTQILQRELPKNEDWSESLELMMRAGTRALQVVRNLLSFARKEEYELVPTDVNENIQRALEMIQHETMARSVTLTFEPGINLPPVMASPDHLQGVWLNIILNALDAIETNPNGVVRITTFVVEDEVRVTISDNGHGISPERLKRMFEPFYTTKEPGRKTGGTGLGLSVSHRIIKQHGGDIFVESQIEQGTTFTVAFPVSEKFKSK